MKLNTQILFNDCVIGNERVYLTLHIAAINLGFTFHTCCVTRNDAKLGEYERFHLYCIVLLYRQQVVRSADQHYFIYRFHADLTVYKCVVFVFSKIMIYYYKYIDNRF